MNASLEARLAKVRKLSRFGNRLCIGAMGFTCLLACLVVVFVLRVPDKATRDFGAGSVPCSALGGGALALTAAFGLVGLTLFLKGLYHLSRLFKNYAAGQVFTRDSVAQIKKVGTTVFAYAVLQIFALLAAVVLMGTQQVTWPEDRPLPLPFAPFVIGGLIVLIASVMEVGTELREDSELTV